MSSPHFALNPQASIFEPLIQSEELAESVSLRQAKLFHDNTQEHVTQFHFDLNPQAAPIFEPRVQPDDQAQSVPLGQAKLFHDNTQERVTQSVTGFLPNKPHEPCWIVSEDWPTWLFVAPPLQLSCTRFFSNSLSATWMTSLLDCYDSVRAVGISQFNELAPKLKSKTLVLLQGSGDFLNDRLRRLPGCVHYLMCLTLGCSCNNKELFRPITHTSCGGTSSGTWEVSSNRVFIWSHPQFLKRGLSSLLDPTMKSWNSPDQKRALDEYDLTQVLPVDSPSQVIVAPSVFSGKCLRPLTLKELLQVFEVPDRVARVLDSFSIADCSFIFKAAPASILLHLGRLALSSPSPGQAPRDNIAGLGLPQRSMEDELTNLNARQEEKAARADDAGIPVYLWDEKFWQSTPHSLDKLEQFISTHNNARLQRKYGCATVCPLQILRHVSHGRWIRNVYTDFIQYAIKTWGRTWRDRLRGTVLLNAAQDALN